MHVGETGMRSAGDQEILTFALKLIRFMVTLDADFHAILAVSACRG